VSRTDEIEIQGEQVTYSDEGPSHKLPKLDYLLSYAGHLSESLLPTTMLKPVDIADIRKNNDIMSGGTSGAKFECRLCNYHCSRFCLDTYKIVLAVLNKKNILTYHHNVLIECSYNI